MESDEPGPSRAALRSTAKATLLRTHLHYTDRAIDESTQPCVVICVSRGGRGCPTSLGLRTLLLDQPPTQPMYGLGVYFTQW